MHDLFNLARGAKHRGARCGGRDRAGAAQEHRPGAVFHRSHALAHGGRGDVQSSRRAFEAALSDDDGECVQVLDREIHAVS